MPPKGQLPPHYTLTLYWRVMENSKRLFWMNMLAMLQAAFGAAFFLTIAVWFGYYPFRDDSWVSWLLGGVAILPIHEAVHGICMQYYGATPKYGINWKIPALYATTPGFAYPRNQFIIIALAPLVVLSSVCVLGMATLVGTPFAGACMVAAVVNASGAAADVWMAGMLLRYPSSAYVQDEADGLKVWTMDDRR